jgi:hypothetical protein
MLTTRFRGPSGFTRPTGLPRLALVLGVALLAGGCGTKLDIPNPLAFPIVQMEKAAVMPVLKTAIGRTRVVVMEPNDPTSAPRAGLPGAAVSAIEQILAKGGMEIVDRNVSGKLKDEIELAAVKESDKAYEGPDVADFAISAVLGNASWSSNYIEPSTYTDKKTGKPVTIPGMHVHGAKANLTIRIYELPTLRLIDTVAAEGSVTKLAQASRASPTRGAELMRAAAQEGVVDSRDAILNQFAAKGYVSERRVNAEAKVSYFRTLLSKRSGAKPGQEVEVVTVQKSVDPLTGKTTIGEYKVAKGVMSQAIAEDHSWIIVTDPKEAAQVHLGDIVRAKFEKSIFGDILRKGLQSF